MILIFLRNLQNQKNQLKKKKNGRQESLNAFESEIFAKEKQVKRFTSI